MNPIEKQLLEITADDAVHTIACIPNVVHLHHKQMHLHNTIEGN